MAMEITNNYNSVYESTYAAQRKQETKKETDDYFSSLAKLAPSVDCRIGTTYASAKSGKTLTINPKLLEKMQSNPEFEKEMKELIKGVEMMTKFSESLNKATGWKTVYRHSYIDENGKYTHFALIRNEAGYKMSEKLRKERRENSEKLIKKIKAKSAKRKEELQEALQEKRAGKGEEKTSKAEKLIIEKIAASKDGMTYMDDADFRNIIEAMKEDEAENIDTKSKPVVGMNLDMQV